MDSTLYNAAISGNIDEILSQINHKSTDQVLLLKDQNSNNILHLASLAGKTEAVEAILSKHPFLVNQVNSHGNSSLHLAAMGGYTDVLRAHVRYSSKDLLWRQNKEGYTAIHEATRYNHIEAVRLLLDQHPGFIPPFESEESLLYMAASRGLYDLVDIFIIILGLNDALSFLDSRWSGPCGRSALHGAVDCNSIDCVRRLLQWDKELLCFTDNSGWTPLDSAAYLGYGNLVSELLLHADSTPAMHVASKALLTAASAGHVSVMKQLLLHSPSCWDKVDAEGKNVLHVAIKHKKKDAIEYLLDECSTIVGILLAQKDKQGNTPLHLLVIFNCWVPKLIHHSMADKEALNYKGLTPLDLGTYNSHNESSTSVAQNEVVEELKRAGAILHSKKPPALAPKDEEEENRKAKLRKQNEYEEAKQKYEEARNANLGKMVDNHMIVAALIATVAFTAGFAMPGGYVSSGSPNAGTAVLSRNSMAFQTFVISDVVALLFSSSALFTYFISPLLHDSEKFANYAEGAMILNMLGLGSIIVAFISGTYAVLHYSYALAIASSVVASFTFLIHFDKFANYAVRAMILNMFGLGSIIVAFIWGTYAVLHYSDALAIASSVVASFTFLIHYGIFVNFSIFTAKQNNLNM